jgi:hypothetical protein
VQLIWSTGLSESLPSALTVGMRALERRLILSPSADGLALLGIIFAMIEKCTGRIVAPNMIHVSFVEYSAD